METVGDRFKAMKESLRATQRQIAYVEKTPENGLTTSVLSSIRDRLVSIDREMKKLTRLVLATQSKI